MDMVFFTMRETEKHRNKKNRIFQKTKSERAAAFFEVLFFCFVFFFLVFSPFVSFEKENKIFLLIFLLGFYSK